MKRLVRLPAATSFMLLLCVCVGAQSSGGQYRITQTVIPGGGGRSSQGATSVNGTIGQGSAGTSGGGSYTLDGGFQHTVQAVLTLSVSDVSQAEDNSGTTAFTFIVSLDSPAPAGGSSVQYATSNGTANGGADCTAGVDYKTAAGTVTLAGGETQKSIAIEVCGDTTPELDETFFVNLSLPVNATLGDSQGTGNIQNDDASVTAGQLIISEFRLRGPNPNGAQNEFIEIYNNTNSSKTVSTTDGSPGYGVAASDGVLRCTIPNGTVIPARGHFLCVNSTGYSLGNYPAGFGPVMSETPEAPLTTAPKRAPTMDTSTAAPNAAQTGDVASQGNEATLSPSAATAAGDATYTTDIPDNAGIALFSSTTTFTLANRLDAVGSTSEANTLYKEGTGYPALSSLAIDYSFQRDLCGKGGLITTLGPCPTGGLPKDTDNNAADFLFVDTNSTSAGAGQRLGAPGPENLSSPIHRNSSFPGPNLDATLSSSSPPNRVRGFTSDPANNSTFGTLELRKRIVNNTGAAVTRLRFRIIDLTTFPAPSGFADLRPRTSTLAVASGINDSGTCLASNGVATTPCTVNVQGTTLEQPPSQLNGGGFNSTLSAGTVTLGTPLANGASINVRFLLGIQQTGTFKFFINVEALP